MKTKTRKKQRQQYQFDYADRTYTLETFNAFPNVFCLKSGNHFPVPESYSNRLVSKIQKQLRQFLYNYLVKNNMDTNNYILNIDAPVKPTSKLMYIEMNVTAPYVGDVLESNQELSKTLIGILNVEFELHNKNGQ